MFNWFSTNHLVANAGKCNFLASSETSVNNIVNNTVNISNAGILNKERVKLLGVNLEGRFSFDFHVNTLLKKTSKKYHALARVCDYEQKYMNKKKRRILMDYFITSQFSYSPLVWMSHSRTMNNRINKIHEKALRFV